MVPRSLAHFAGKEVQQRYRYLVGGMHSWRTHDHDQRLHLAKAALSRQGVLPAFASEVLRHELQEDQRLPALSLRPTVSPILLRSIIFSTIGTPTDIDFISD